MELPVSVVVPAHDEAAVIGRALAALQAGAERDELELIVVCNGCRDDTATVARAAAPGAHVVEIDVASKSEALNVGDRLATRFPRFFVDADVELTIDALRATARRLVGPPILCAAPAPRFELTDRPWFVRQFVRTLERMPFLVGAGVVGSGVYALSEDGRRRFEEFPPITADDQFVMERFTERERLTVREVTFTVHPPRDLRGLLNMRTRSYRGNEELHRYFPPVEPARHDNRGALVAMLSARDRAPGVPVYVAVNLLAKLRARRRWNGVWERDDSARTPARARDDVIIDETWTVFLDRDGVINRHIVGDYVRSWEDFEFVPGALEALAVLACHAGPIIVVTNQAGVGKGLMSEDDLAHIHREMVRRVEAAGGRIDAVLHCPHRVEDGCRCRKPAPGLAHAARARFPAIDPARSVMVGDSQLDIEFGERLGMQTVLVGEQSLLDAAHLLIA